LSRDIFGIYKEQLAYCKSPSRLTLASLAYKSFMTDLYAALRSYQILKVALYVDYSTKKKLTCQ
jgi:hypothetical protein